MTNRKSAMMTMMMCMPMCMCMRCNAQNGSFLAMN